MTISPRASSVLRCLFVVVLSVIAFVANREASHWVLVLSLSALATMAVMRTPNVLLHWPIGLLAVVGATYGQYLWQWITGPTGVTTDSASTTFRMLIGLFGVIALVRSAVGRQALQLPTPLRVFAAAVMVALPAVLIVLVTSRWFDDPVRIISGHLGGGDHGPHNKIVHGLLQESGQISFVSPFQMYSYPQSLHFFIANLVAVTRSVSDLPLLAQEYAMGAWFEWLQFAAFCQISLVIFMDKAKSPYRVLFVPALVFVFSTMDNFVVQMLWSGFTTSIGITWILLVFALLAEKVFSNDEFKEFVQSILALSAFAVVSWTIYQPYSAIFVVLLALLIVQKLGTYFHENRSIQLIGALISRPLVVLGGVAGSMIIIMLVGLGKESPAVTSLSLEGSTFTPFLYTVLLWAFLAIALTRYRNVQDFRSVSGLESFTIVHPGFVVGFASTVVITSDFGFLNLPYYPQKMLWTLLFVSLPIALAQGFSIFEEYLNQKSRIFKLRATGSLLLVVVMIPLIQGRTPSNATKHVTVNWFAQGMVLPVDNTEASAFSMRDKLGSHMANLALQSVSKSFLTPDIAISGSPYLGCKYIELRRATSIYTTANGRAELLESGCSPNRTFIEDGNILAPTRLTYFGVKEGQIERFERGQLGFRLLLRGFLPPESWGIWGGGYRSALGFQYESAFENPQLELMLRANPQDEMVRSVIVSANDVEIGRQVLSLDGFQKFQLPLPSGKAGTSIELTITCEREDEEILKDDPTDGPNACFGLKTMRILEGNTQN